MSSAKRGKRAVTNESQSRVGPVDAIVRHFTRIDPRSLGLFRIAFGLTLILDWCQRWANRTAFYSNDGVLPNHNHLFHLKNEGRLVWSGLHAFSTPGEAAVGLCVLLAFYVFLTLGWKTRVFQALSLVALVSLSARNTLAEGPGESLAIALAALTLFLPLGSAFSIDAIVAKARSARETKPAQLLDPSVLYDAAEIQRGHRPGYSPRSIAAFGALALIAMVLLSLAKQQTGTAWMDGSALHRALNVFLIASPLGFSMKDSSLLGPLTQLLRATQWLVPALLVVPVFRGLARGVAATLLVVYGLTYALLTNFTLFGLCIASAAALVIAQDTWERWATRHDPKRARTVIFDVDCGICFWLAKNLRRYDTRQHLLSQGNGDFPPEAGQQQGPPEAGQQQGPPEAGQQQGPPEAGDEPEELELPALLVRDAKTGAIAPRPMPKGITSALVEQTIVVVRPDGSFATRGAAIAEILRALPGLSVVGLFLGLPGIAALRDRLYDVIARKRTTISVELGLNACGVMAVTKDVPLKEDIAPSTALRFKLQTALRESAATLLFLAIAIQISQANDLGARIETKKLEPITWWARVNARWDVLTPEPPTEESLLVVDAQTRDGVKLDLMTGQPATTSFDRPFLLGGQWATYLTTVTNERERAFQDAMRKYFTRRGPRYEPPEAKQILTGADAFWVTKPLFEDEPLDAERLFRHSRGGAVLNQGLAPLTRSVPPSMRRRPVGREAPRPEPELDEPTEDEEDSKPLPLRYPESPGQELQ